MGQSPNPDWMNQWQDLSRNYLAAWQTMSRTAETPSPAPSWQDGFESWSRLFAAGGAQNETIDRIIDSAKGYAAFMQSLLAAGGAGHATAAPWSDWMRPGAGIPGMDAAAFDNPMLRAMRDLQGQGGGFAQMMSAFGAPRAPTAGAFSPPGDLSELKAWLNLPAFGVMREQQEHRQKTATVWIEYQEQMGRYNALMLKATQRGFQLFEGKLSEREQPGRQIESLRALYDLWVDAAEEGYAEVALSQEFREVYGAMVNAQMRVRAQMQHEMERIAVDFGMPTRSEVNSLGERLQALRREVRQRGETNADQGLAREVARLRTELAALKASMNNPVRAAAPLVARSKEKSKDKPDAKFPAKPKPRPDAKIVPIEPARARAKSASAASKREAASKKRRKSRKLKSERVAKRAVAAKASSTFASRIAEFADASLGNSRTPRLKKKAKSGKSKKKNRA